MSEQGPGGSSPALRSIWLRPPRAARGPAPEHSAAEIARAAVALADAGGLAAVTMRAVAAAVGTGAASLYRYVDTRTELLELMVDAVMGEYPADSPADDDPVAGLLHLARQTRAIIGRHPWLIDVTPATLGPPGPGTLAYMEQFLAILRGTGLSGAAKLEIFGLFTGAVRSFAQAEIEQQRAGADLLAWTQSVADYLLQAVATGRYPELAAALSGRPAPGDPPPAGPVFDRAMTRILSGLLPPRRPPGPPAT